jgi:hypothetical protein
VSKITAEEAEHAAYVAELKRIEDKGYRAYSNKDWNVFTGAESRAWERGWDRASREAGDTEEVLPLAPSMLKQTFQTRVAPWFFKCFSQAVCNDTKQRNHRFLEEALELVQACDCTAEEAHMLVDYVFGRPVGEKGQEVGGTMVTLAALCIVQSIDMHGESEKELTRINTPEMIERIRAKQKTKPYDSPLPGFVQTENGPVPHRVMGEPDHG